MSKLVECTFMTLDGVISSPEKWGMPYWDDEHEKYTLEQVSAADALLLGRHTYEGFAEAWSPRGGTIADRMNELPKYVASSTLTETTWNASLLEGDVAEQVAALKQQGDGTILKFGTGVLDHTLVKHNLVDELQLLVYPVAVGNDLSDHEPAGGQRLSDGFDMTHMKLVDSTTFTSGIINLVYAPAGGTAGPALA